MRRAGLGWLRVTPHVTLGNIAPFRPFQRNASAVADPWIGETALLGNLAPTETRPPVHFSTDALGHRLTPGVPPGSKVDFLLWGGASFAFGASLSDEETFSAVLTAAHGLRVYNGASLIWGFQSLPDLDRLLARLQAPQAGIIDLYWEGRDISSGELEGLPGLGVTDAPLTARALRDYADLSGALSGRIMRAASAMSPMAILSERLYKRLSNDRLLPNRYLDWTRSLPLPDGRRFLMVAPRAPENPAKVAEHYARLRQHLAAQGRRLYVVLIPDKLTVYGPWIDPRYPSGAKPYPDVLEEALRREGIQVLNALPALRKRAAEDLRSGDLAYYREDHHWTPLGVRRVAEAFAKALAAEEPRLPHAL